MFILSFSVINPEENNTKLGLHRNTKYQLIKVKPAFFWQIMLYHLLLVSDISREKVLSFLSSNLALRMHLCKNKRPCIIFRVVFKIAKNDCYLPHMSIGLFVCLSILLSLHMEQLHFHWTDFILEYFSKICRRNQDSLKSVKKKGTLHEYAFNHIFLSSP